VNFSRAPKSVKILSTAPARISLFGSGTDVPAYADVYRGIVLSMAINLRQHLTMFSGDDLHEVNGANTFPYRANPDFYYKILDEYKINDMHHTKLVSEFDGLLEAGLGSSASAAVALLGAINKRLDLRLSRDEIAQKAWELETGKLGLFGGKQDQWAATYGGVNVFQFDKEGVTTLALDRTFIEPILPYFVLLFTGYHRESSKIQEGLKELSGPQVEKLDQIKDIAMKGIQAVADKDIKKVAELLNQSWELKKGSNSGVSNPDIDNIFKKAFELGAMGGKLLGSGGGGFALFMVAPELRAQFIEGMGLEEFDFNISWDGLDTRIIK
jgi:D-glycero-alpha-D-manno-heptose-7-phosphate kinase